MDWEQKFAALNALTEATLKMRNPGDWYVSQSVEVKEKGRPVLEGRWGDGTDPESAVNEHWQELTELNPNEYLVVNAYGDGERRAVRWNGFMWDHVKEAT